MRSFSLLIKFFLALLLVGSVHAETIPATSGDVWKWCGGGDGNYCTNTWQEAGGACGGGGWQMFDGGYNGFVNAYQCSKNGAYLSPHTLVNPTLDQADACRGVCQNGSTMAFGKSLRTGYTCPTGQNWTVSGSNCTRPDCTGSEVRNPSTGVCEVPPCTSKGQAASGLFLMGSSPYATFKAVTCTGGCLAVFSGTAPAKYAMVGGQRMYYAQGAFDFMGNGSGDTCTPGAEAPATPASSPNLGPQSCAPGQIEGEVNGVFQCWNTKEEANTATEKAAKEASTPSTEKTTSTTTVNNDNSTTTTTTTNHAGGGTTTTTKTCDQSGSNCSTTTEKAGFPEGGLGGGAAALGTLYTEDTSKTFAGSINNFRTAWGNAPIVAASGNFFRVGQLQGSCSGMSSTFNLLGQSVTIDLSPHFCADSFNTLPSYVAIGLLLAASAAAFWIAIL